MNSYNFTIPPSWITHPTLFKNVIDHQFSASHNISSFTSLNDTSSLSRGFRQASYWRKQLVPSVSPFSVIFTFLGPQGLLPPSILEVSQALKNVCNIQNITEIYKSVNSNFIGFSFSNSEDASKVRSNFTYYNNSVVFHVLPSSPLHHDFKLLWLPPLFNINRVHHFLRKFSIIHSIKPVLTQTDDDIFLPTNTLTGTLELLPDVSLQNLPHLIPLPSPHLGCALLIIDGRPPICLKCRQEGHLRKHCTVSKCSNCKLFHPLSSSCTSSSYSHALTNSTTQAINSTHQANWIEDADFDVSSDQSHIVTSVSDASQTSLTTMSSPNDLTQSTSCFTSKETTSFHDLSNFTLAKTHQPSSVDLIDSINTASSPSPDTVPNNDFIIISKHITHSRTTAKRPLNSTSRLFSSSTGSVTKHSNIFSSLPDEADDTNNDSTTVSHNAAFSVASSCQDISSNLIKYSSEPSIASQPESSKKRAKILITSFTSTYSSPPESDLGTTPSAWADQVELDIPLQSHPSTDSTKLNIDTYALPSAPDTTTYPPNSNSGTNLQPSSHLSSSSDSDDSASGSQDNIPSSYASTVSAPKHSSYSRPSSSSLPSLYNHLLDPALHVFISGFPKDTVRGAVIDFLGSLSPVALWHIRDSHQSFIGHFGATFSSLEDASLAINMNGQPHLNNTISICQLSLKT